MAEDKIDAEVQALVDSQQGVEDEILSKENVVGVGIGNKIKDEKETGDRCISVLVSQKLDKALIKEKDKNVVTETVGKFKTDVIESGEFFAGNTISKVDTETDVDVQTLAVRARPAMGGYSVGHFRVTAGTIATGVTDSSPYPGIPPSYYLLSNNHVLANSNDAKIGDPILQPGRVDGGVLPTDIIGRLSRFVNIDFYGKNNYVDAAIAKVQFHNLNREIYWIGYVEGVAISFRPFPRPNLKIGDIVQKCGRTTNFTTGKVTQLFATVNVNYGGGRIAKFVRQIITTNMSAPGDSGSLLLTRDRDAAGLLFAGSSKQTIHNEIFFVQRLLNIRLTH